MTQTQFLEDILYDDSFSSIDQSESLQDFLNARQNHLDEMEISARYRVLEGKAQKFKEYIGNLCKQLNGRENASGNTIYEDQEICSSDFFYRQGFFEGIKCLLLAITGSPAKTNPASPEPAGQTLSGQITAALLNYNLTKSLEAFVTARTGNF